MDARIVATQWIDHWNTRDVEGVLSKFADDVVFRSHKAHDIVGTGEVRGKPALRAYWNTALSRATSLHFELDHAAFDPAREELFIVYVAAIDGKRVRACERLRFAGGVVVEGEATYGAPA